MKADATRATPDAPQVPTPGEFFDPDPRSLEPGGQILSIGPPRIEIGRLGTRKFRLLRRVGYRDPVSDKTWVVPRELDKWKLSLSSAPTNVNWIIPVRGSHFNAFVLHDGLVEDAIFDPDRLRAEGDAYEGTDYIGPKVRREQADRIMRDAMKSLGTGFFRRWAVWAGTMVGTLSSEESLGGSGQRSRWIARLVVWALLIIALGCVSTSEILGWSSTLPAIYDRPILWRFVIGAVGAVVAPAILAVIWGRRYLFGFMTGVCLAFLLPTIVATTITVAPFVIVERLFNARSTRGRPTDLPPLTFGRREGIADPFPTVFAGPQDPGILDLDSTGDGGLIDA